MSEIMQGFPVPPEQRIPRSEWDRPPWNRWSFQHVREILPTAEMWRGDGKPWKLARKEKDLANVHFVTSKNTTTTVQHWLDTSYTDAFLVMHNGKIAFEQYHNGMNERSLHLAQSMTKSFTAVLAGILIGRGLLNPAEKISKYLPELEATGWQGASLQQVMDMTTGVIYNEDYDAVDSDIAVTDVASGWKLPHHGREYPACIWDQIVGLTGRSRKHGALFEYRSIETDVLAHCLERVTQTRLAELMSRELWQPLGCEENACFTVDSVGYALADGGLNACLRDYARFGQMLLQQGKANGRQIVPRAFVEDIPAGNHDLFKEPYTLATPNGAYHNQFWIEDVDTGAFMARGVFGQLIYVDTAHQMVVVKLSSWPEFVSLPRLKTKLRAIHAIADYLNN